jgi:hypothetical protein
MQQGKSVLAAAVLMVCSCKQDVRQQAPHNAEQPANFAPREAQPPIPRPATGPDAKTPFAEPKGAIDPKSAEAAGQVVQHYGALIEQKRLDEAAKLWGDAKAAAVFARDLQTATHLEIGELGGTEGAAGSIYTTVPVVFYGNGRRRYANIILRRVNDVPGSTAAQRSWHIERVEWKEAG